MHLSNEQNMKNKLVWIAPSLIVLVYFAYNFFFSVNFPFQDDLLLIQFIEAVSQGHLGFTGTIHEMFRTFNDHKAVVPRFISLVEYGLTGTLNFRFYIVLVSVNITYIFYFLYLQFRKTGLPIYYLLPAFLLYFHPLYHDVSGWALNGMQHTFLTAFTVTAILLVARNTKIALALAIFCCFLATFTHGNGILSYPAVVFYLLCIKAYKKAGIVLVGMFASLGVYLIGYESGQAMHLPDNVITFVTSLFGLVGSLVSLWGQPELWSVLFGILICVAGFILLFRIIWFYKGSTLPLKPGVLELLSVLVFIFITSLVIAIFRSWAGTTITSRFQLYTCMSTVIFYIFLLNYLPVFRKRGVLAGMICISLFYWAYSYYTYTTIVARKKAEYQADLYNWKYNRNMFSVPRLLLVNADFYLTPAYEKGIFNPTAPPVSKQVVDSLFALPASTSERYESYIETAKPDTSPANTADYDSYYYVSSIKLPAYKHFLDDRFLVLRDTKTGKTFLKNGNPRIQSRQVILTKGQYYKPGFSAFFRPDDLDAGVYQMAILDIYRSGDKKFYRIDNDLKMQDGVYRIQ